MTKPVLFALSLTTALAHGCGSDSAAPRYNGSGTLGDGQFETGYGAVGAGQTRSSDISALVDARGSYLADAQGRALYLFAADIPGRNESACEEACAEQWPPFDVRDLAVDDDDLSAADFARFERSDGEWQTTFKGRPLYYYAMDGATGEISGDGVGGKWFVARDYSVFLTVQPDLIPEGADDTAPYLTSRGGRTSYVLLNDRPNTRGKPISDCGDDCIASWPVWVATTPLSDMVLPSTLLLADFGWFEREDGERQLTYRGWPLYYYADDLLPGDTRGHELGDWRAIDPLLFASDAAAEPDPG